VIWFHDGDGGASLAEKERFDLRAYLDVGGVRLLSGAAGRVLNDLGIEPTPLRVLGPTAVTYVSGIRVLDKHRNHPAFAGLDTTKPVPVLVETAGRIIHPLLLDWTRAPAEASARRWLVTGQDRLQ
jgi:hypothetical protein